MMIKKEIMIELILKVIWTEMVAMSTVLTGVAYVDCTESDGSGEYAPNSLGVLLVMIVCGHEGLIT